MICSTVVIDIIMVVSMQQYILCFRITVNYFYLVINYPVGWGWRIRWLLLCKGLKKTHQTSVLWPSRLGLQNTLTAPLLRGKIPLPMSVHDMTLNNLMFPGCNGYRRRKCTRRHEFKSWTRLIAFHIALILLGKVWIQIFSLQLWVNSCANWVFQTWWGN